jgi:hypothetical protein
VPDLNWIGVFPRDIDTKDRVQLEATETKKLHRLLDKEHVNVVVEWRGELMSMDQCGYNTKLTLK